VHVSLESQAKHSIAFGDFCIFNFISI